MTSVLVSYISGMIFLLQSSSFCSSSTPSEINFDQKIHVVGGEPANTGEFPFQLSMRWNGRHFCGATLVQSYFLPGTNIALTAAHCVSSDGTGKFTPPKNLTVVGGSILLSDNSSSVQTSEVLKVIMHEDYVFPENDIAILILYKHFRISSTLNPASLPLEGEGYQGNLTVSGWGLTEEGSHTLPDHLQFAVIPVIANDKCAEMYAEVEELGIFPSNICAGIDAGGIDTCQGDSGGPGTSKVTVTEYQRGYHYYGKTEKFILQAITSWGVGCARPGLPGVYTRVSSYIKWIKHNTAFYG